MIVRKGFDKFIEKKEFETDEQVLEAITKFGVSTVPVLVINNHSTVSGHDILSLLMKFKSI